MNERKTRGIGELRALVKALESGLDLMAAERDQDEWLVPSLSRPRLLHVVTRQPGGVLACDCEACAFGHKACVHREAVAALLERQQHTAIVPSARTAQHWTRRLRPSVAGT